MHNALRIGCGITCWLILTVGIVWILETLDVPSQYVNWVVLCTTIIVGIVAAYMIAYEQKNKKEEKK